MIQVITHFYRTNRMWFFLLLASCVVYLYTIFLYVMPEYQNQAQIKEEIRQSKSQIEQVEKNRNSRFTIEKKKKIIQKEISELIHSQSQDMQLSTLLTLLSSSAQQNHITILKIAPSPGNETLRFVEQPIQMTLEGNYHQLGDFIHWLETSDFIIRINDIECSRLTSESEQLKAKLALSFFYIKRVS